MRLVVGNYLVSYEKKIQLSFYTARDSHCCRVPIEPTMPSKAAFTVHDSSCCCLLPYLDHHERITALDLRVKRLKEISKGDQGIFRSLIGTPQEYVYSIMNHVTPHDKYHDLVRICSLECELMHELKFWQRNSLCHQNTVHEAEDRTIFPDEAAL